MSERAPAPTGLHLSVRWKIVILLALVVGAITGLDAWLVPTRAAEAERQSLRERSQAAAAMLADAIQPALEFEQTDVAQEGLRAALADPLMLWAAAYDRDGQRMTAVGSGSPTTQTRAMTLSRMDSGMVAGVAEIATDDGTRLGWVAVGLRGDVILERRASTQQTIAIQGSSSRSWASRSGSTSPPRSPRACRTSGSRRSGSRAATSIATWICASRTTSWATWRARSSS